MPKYRPVICDSCEVLVINNVICHETGCPDAWKDETRVVQVVRAMFQTGR